MAAVGHGMTLNASAITIDTGDAASAAYMREAVVRYGRRSYTLRNPDAMPRAAA